MPISNEKLFQLATLRMTLGATEPQEESKDLVGNVPVRFDRLQARIIVTPGADGALPTEDAVKALERSIRFRFALDRNERRMVTIGSIAVGTLQQLEGSPVQIPPFTVNRGDQPKVKIEAHPNVWANAIFKFPKVELELTFWGIEA